MLDRYRFVAGEHDMDGTERQSTGYMIIRGGYMTISHQMEYVVEQQCNIYLLEISIQQLSLARYDLLLQLSSGLRFPPPVYRMYTLKDSLQ